MRHAALILAVVLASAARVLAQQVPVDPTSTHIFPAGGRRGTTVEVHVGGECLPPATNLRFWGEGVSAPPVLGDRVVTPNSPSPRRNPQELQVTYPKEWLSSVRISPDAPLGPALWRLSCARGGTGARPFIVGDLPEVLESEPNNQSDLAQKVELPVTLNGQINGECDLDYFQFFAHAGDVIHADVVACRLGSALDPVVELYDPQGQRLRVQEARASADPVLAFRASADGMYRLMVSNVNFHGGPDHVYRITLSTAPYIRFAFPPGGQAGTTHTIELTSLGAEGAASIFTQDVVFPGDASATYWFTPRMPGANRVPLVVGSLNETVEAEPNDRQANAQELTWPITANGQFTTASDEDWYRLHLSAQTPIAVECLPAPRGAPTLAKVSVMDAQGKVLATSNAFAGVDGRCRLEWTAAADGDYWLQLRDAQFGTSGGADFIYRLSIEAARPDFELSLKSDALNLMPGARAELEVNVERRGGFAGAIDLAISGLPAGVKAENPQIPAGQVTHRLALVAEDTAPSCAAPLRIVGQTTIDNLSVERVALATHLGHDADGVSLGSSVIDNVQLTVQHKPVFKLYCNEAYQYAHRGTVYRYLMEVERLDGFDGPIRLQVADRQNKDLDGIEVLETTIAPGETQVMLPLYLPETMHINIQAHSNVYAQGWVTFQDAQGQTQSLLVVSTMRCMIRTLPTVARLKSPDKELLVRAGSPTMCRLQLDRTPLFEGPMRVEILEAPAGITAEPVVISADAKSAELQLRVDAGCTARSGQMLRIRAVGEWEHDSQVISEVTLPLRVE